MYVSIIPLYFNLKILGCCKNRRSSRPGVLKKKYSENLQHIYRKYPCRSAWAAASVTVSLQNNLDETLEKVLQLAPC